MKYRLSASAVVLSFFAMIGMGTLTTSGTASDVGAVDKAGKAKEAIELQKKSEEFKDKIIKSAPTKPNGPVEYTVQAGDTLSEIAAMYRVLPSAILSSSGLKRAEDLKPGQKIKIPNRPGLLYRMKVGDSVAAVAMYYTVSLEDIEADNPDLTDMDMIRPGTRVFLPNAKIPPPPPVWFRPGWGGLSSGFGVRRDPFGGGFIMHTGLDIVMYYAQVRAARSGVVVYAGGMGSYGNAVVVQHAEGLKTLYAHLSSIRVRTGQEVAAGQEIAISGNTGLSTGPHLHFEVIQNGRPMNPLRFVRF